MCVLVSLDLSFDKEEKCGYQIYFEIKNKDFFHSSSNSCCI